MGLEPSGFARSREMGRGSTLGEKDDTGRHCCHAGELSRGGATAHQVAEICYHNLFSLDPEPKGLFRSDMYPQGSKLMQMTGLAVYGLKSPEILALVTTCQLLAETLKRAASSKPQAP